MPKKVMESIYLYDKGERVSPNKYNSPLFQDIDREMQTRTRDAQVDLMMDLAFLQMALPDSDQNKNVINNYVNNYFLPMDVNGNLRKEEFESRWQKLEERKMERIYYPEGKFSLAQQGKHCDDWVAQKIAANKPGLMDGGLLNSLMKMYDQAEIIERAYGGEGANEVLQEISGKATEKILGSMSKEDRKTGREGLNYVRAMNAHQYTPEEKEVQKALKEKDLASGDLKDVSHEGYERTMYEKSCAYGYYTGARDVNLGFVTNPTIYNAIQDSISKTIKERSEDDLSFGRTEDTIMDDISEQIADFDRQVFDKDVNGSRLFDSKEFNTIKDDLERLKKDLQKGNTLKNLKDIKYSMEIFSEHCQKYLDKNPGTRMHKRGNTRKRIVQALKLELDGQCAKIEKAFGKEIKEKDSEWMNVEKVETENKVKIKLSYADLSGKKNEPVNRISRPSNPAKENVKDGPAI